jgi:hypothetical protein
MNIKKKEYVGKSIIFGGIGGFVASLVMLPFMMLTAIMAGMPTNTMPTAIGLAFGSGMNDAAMVGFGMHILTGTLIGIIFGAVTGRIKGLMLTRISRAIAEGLITGIIAFVVLFIPVSTVMMPPVLMNLATQMQRNMAPQEIMVMLQQKMPMMFGIGIIEHLVYGAVLGTIGTILILKVEVKSEEYNKKALS